MNQKFLLSDYSVVLFQESLVSRLINTCGENVTYRDIVKLIQEMKEIDRTAYWKLSVYVRFGMNKYYDKMTVVQRFQFKKNVLNQVIQKSQLYKSLSV